MTQGTKKLRAVPSLHEIRSGLRHACHYRSKLLISHSYHLSSSLTRVLPSRMKAVANMGTSTISLRGDRPDAGRHLHGDHGATHNSQRTGSISRYQLHQSPRERLSAATTQAFLLPQAARPSPVIRCGGHSMRDLFTTPQFPRSIGSKLPAPSSKLA